jgi:BlaI family transcriptional regulator, penicillinase repressor
MPRNATERLTPLEFEIMSVLWETGPANVQAVQQRLPRTLAYTTVQTMLNILHRKKKVKRLLKDRAYFYTASVSRRQVTRQTLSDVVERLFGGSASSLVMSLVETNHLTAEELARLNQLVTKAESGKESDVKS